MSSSPRRFSGLVLFSLALLTWTILLAVWLRYFLGAEVSDSWLVIGLTVTVIGAGVLLLIKELMDVMAVPENPANRCAGDPRRQAAGGTRPRRGFLTSRQSITAYGSPCYRSELGLPPLAASGKNRMRRRVRTG